MLANVAKATSAPTLRTPVSPCVSCSAAFRCVSGACAKSPWHRTSVWRTRDSSKTQRACNPWGLHAHTAHRPR